MYRCDQFVSGRETVSQHAAEHVAGAAGVHGVDGERSDLHALAWS